MPRTISRNGIIAIVALLSACGSGMPIEEARLAKVVTVDGVSLDGATLENLMLGAPDQARPSPQAANLFISSFVDAALLRGAILKGNVLSDSLVIRQAIMPDAILGVIREGMRARINELPPITDAQADSLGRLGSVRVFQQILYRVADFQDSLEENRVKAQLKNAMQKLDEGADFAELARRESEDTVSRDQGGMLPAVSRDAMPAGPVADAAWRLAPGEFSRPAVSPAGVHIIRRVPLEAARGRLKAWLVPRIAAQQDSIWLDSARTASHVMLPDGAIERTRQLVVEPYSGGGDAALATWDGGQLTPDRVRMWFSVLTGPQRAGLPFASDSVISTFLRDLVDREIRWQATGESDPVPARAWTALSPQLKQVLYSMVENYGPMLTTGDSSTATQALLVAAAAGTIQYRPLPGSLGMILRRDADVKIDQAAVAGIIGSTSQGYALAKEQDSLNSIPHDTGRLISDSL